MVDVTFLILNYNGKELTAGLIDSILKSDFNKKFEIVVVDNASSGDDVSFFKEKYPDVILVENKDNLGTPGVNTAIPFISGDYVFFLNNDIVLMPDTTQKIFDYISSNKDVGIIAPRPINYYKKDIKSGGCWISRAFYGGHYKDDSVNSPFEVPYAGIFMFRKEIVDKRGFLFDPDYFIYSEDVDFCLASWVMGYRIIFFPQAEFYHMHAQTIKAQKNYKLTYLIERNILSTFLKNMSVWTIIKLLPYVALMRLVGLVKDIFTFKFMNAFFRLRAVFYVLFHIGKILKKRKKVQSLRKFPDKRILKLFSEKYLLKPVVPV